MFPFDRPDGWAGKIARGSAMRLLSVYSASRILPPGSSSYTLPRHKILRLR